MLSRYFKIKTLPKDDFLKRLSSSVIGEGMLNEGNIYLIDYAIKNMPKKGYVLEIGSYAGLSTNLILHFLNKHKRTNTMMGCDAWVYEGFNDKTGKINNYIDGRMDIDRSVYTNYIKNAFINATKLFHSDRLPFTCHLKSDDFFERWNENKSLQDVFGRSFNPKGGIAFSYIDGDHSYKQTKRDFENISEKLQIGGYILFDDSAKHLKYGSAKFIQEIKKNPKFKIVDSNPNFLVKKIA